MSETAQATRFGAREWAIARPWLAARWFPLGVAAITVAAAAFLLHQLLAWPPHEDETLPLFVGRHPLVQLFQVVLEERGGAPLHFLLAWAVAHLGLGLDGLRAVSAFFAVASLPVVALLLARLAGRASALVGTLLVAASWTFLFHGVYGRMYSLFLFTTALSYLALLRALERGGRRAWALWALAILATVATHPYGALVLASQAAFVVAARRDRLRQAVWAFGAVASSGSRSGSPISCSPAGSTRASPAGSRSDVVEYVWQAAGDFTAGFPVLPAVLVAAAAGLAVLPRETRILAACAVDRPARALVVARSTGSPETRHLIFLLPFFALAVGAGIARLGRVWGSAALAALVVAQVAWAWHRTPQLFEWEPDVRREARADAAAYSRPRSGSDDVLLGYDPLYLQAWERLRTCRPSCSRAPTPTSRCTASSRSSGRSGAASGCSTRARPRTSTARSRSRACPAPEPAFEVRVFGPFLVIRTREPAVTPKRFLERAGQAMLVGKRLYLGDADINLPTIERAARALRGYGASRSLSTSSR